MYCATSLPTLKKAAMIYGPPYARNRAIHREGELDRFLSSCCQASSNASPVFLVWSDFAKPQRSFSVRNTL